MEKREIYRRTASGLVALGMGLVAFKYIDSGVQGKIDATKLSLAETDVNSFLAGKDRETLANSRVQSMSTSASADIALGFGAGLGAIVGAQIALRPRRGDQAADNVLSDPGIVSEVTSSRIIATSQ